MSKEQIIEHMRIIKSWKEQTLPSKITSTLQRFLLVKSVDPELLSKLSKLMAVFHKQINKSQDQIPKQWFENTLKVKKHIQMLEVNNQNKKAKPALQKRPSQVVQYPPNLFDGKSQRQQKYLKVLYKGFIYNFQPQQLTPKVVPFIQDLLIQIKKTMENTQPSHVQADVAKRIQKISNTLMKDCKEKAKISMLSGQISLQLIAKNDENAFMDEQQKEKRIQLLKEQLQSVDTNFYSDMKKNINKDASEQCRYCHKHKAYCQDMKQIRASDQPMTRFMKCNACGKNWRD